MKDGAVGMGGDTRLLSNAAEQNLAVRQRQRRGAPEKRRADDMRSGGDGRDARG